MNGTWKVANDAEPVHALLCTSDRYQAERYASTVPQRQIESTRRKVEAGIVHLLWIDDEPAGMFTLSREPSFDLAEAGFPSAHYPLYLSRLAVAPDLLPYGGGMRCVRKAIELAQESGADVVRCEANPDLEGTRELLDAMGFRQHGPVRRDGNGVPRIHLQRRT